MYNDTGMALTDAERQRRRRARVTAQAARLRGDLVPEPCVICSKEPTDAHHARGYDNPLDVTWLCPAHHREAHSPNTHGESNTPLRQIRLAAGLSLSETARRAGINKGRLSIIERGVSPTEDESRAILAALQVTVVPPEPSREDVA